MPRAQTQRRRVGGAHTIVTLHLQLHRRSRQRHSQPILPVILMVERHPDRVSPAGRQRPTDLAAAIVITAETGQRGAVRTVNGIAQAAGTRIARHFARHHQPVVGHTRETPVILVAVVRQIPAPSPQPQPAAGICTQELRRVAQQHCHAAPIVIGRRQVRPPIAVKISCHHADRIAGHTIALHAAECAITVVQKRQQPAVAEARHHYVQRPVQVQVCQNHFIRVRTARRIIESRLERPVPVPQQHTDGVVSRIEHDHVQIRIPAVHPAQRHEPRTRSRRDVQRRLKTPVPVAQQQTHVARIHVGHRQIRLPIIVHIAHRHGPRTGTHAVIGPHPKRPVPVAQQHAHRSVAFVGHGQIQFPVLIEITRGQIPRAAEPAVIA